MSIPNSVSPDALRQQLRYLQDAIAQNKTLLTAVAATAAQAGTDASTALTTANTAQTTADGAQTDATAALAAIAALDIVQEGSSDPGSAPVSPIRLYINTKVAGSPKFYFWCITELTWFELTLGAGVFVP